MQHQAVLVRQSFLLHIGPLATILIYLSEIFEIKSEIIMQIRQYRIDLVHT